MADFVGMSVAVIIVTASIILAGIIIGVGRAFSYKRIENFGIEELLQSVINAAIIGALASIISIISGVSASIVSAQCGSGDAPAQLACSLSKLEGSLFLMFQETVKALNILGYYQSLVLDFDVFSIQPFENLSSISGVLSNQVFTMQLLVMLIELNVQILNFVGENALLLLLPIGLVLRTFFVTRKAGGFMIALSIALYVLYPSFILIFPDPLAEVNNATVVLSNFTNNSMYATVPVVDLNDNYALGAKLDLMSGRCSGNLSNSSICANMTKDLTNSSVDFTGDLTLLTQANSNAISKVLLYSVIAPLLSLVVTIVFVKEVGDILGSEIGLSTFSVI
jgi:hypothetical protein